MSSPSSSSRRWADDYTDDEDDEVPRRSYCEVLRSGSPPTGSGSRATSSSPPLAPSGVDSPEAPAAAGRPWAVDDSVRRLASLVVQPPWSSPQAARAAPPGARPWTAARGRKRPRGQQATLPAWSIRAGLPSNLAGACFNCTRTCHISAECTYETVCLRCGEEGHHARACPQNRRAGADRRGGQDRGVAAPGGSSAQQRFGPREPVQEVAAPHARAPVADRGKSVELGSGCAPVMPVEPSQGRYRIPARKRLGLGAPSPPVEAADPGIPAHMRLGEHGRGQPPPPPPPPPFHEAAGSSTRPAPRDRPAGGGAAGRGAFEVQRQDTGRPEAHARSPHRAADGQGTRASSRPEREASSRLPEVESVFLPRTAEIDAAEAALRYALVAFVSGKHTYIPLSEAGAALAARVPRAEDNFTVHRSWPADFLFVCSSRRVHDEIMAADASHGRDFSLRFTPWNRQLQAMQCRMRFRAHFELTGAPAHAWNRTTATAILCSDAWVECLGAATANREDLGRFQVVAWTNNASAFPKTKEVLIEEPDDLMEEDEGLVLPGSALIPLEKKILRYRVTVHVAHAEDMLPVDEESDGDEDRDGGGDHGPERRRDGGDRSDHRRDEHGNRDGRQEEDERGCGRGRDGREERGRRPLSRHGDALRRRPSGGGGWGGSRRVALNTVSEVTPWPEVEDADVDEGVDGVGCMQPAGPTVESSPRLSADSGIVTLLLQPSGGPTSDPLLHGVGGMVGTTPDSPRGSPGLADEDIRGRSPPAGPAPKLLAPFASTSCLDASGWTTLVLTRVRQEESDREEGECRSGRFESVVKEKEGPLFDQLVEHDFVQGCQLSWHGVIPTPSLQGWTSPEESVGSVGESSPRSVLEYFPVSISPVDKGLLIGPMAVESVSLGLG
ncbi:hypothetical protein ACQ4PT_011305 [Festuca glaucescens]